MDLFKSLIKYQYECSRWNLFVIKEIANVTDVAYNLACTLKQSTHKKKESNKQIVPNDSPRNVRIGGFQKMTLEAIIPELKNV